MAYPDCYQNSPYICTYDSGGGKDVDNIDTWEADTDIDITGQGIHGLKCYASQNHNQNVTLSGATTDATHYRAIYTAADCSPAFAGYHGTGANFVCNASGNLFSLNEGYVRIYKLCISKTEDVSGTVYAVNIPGDYCKVIDCVIFDSVNPTGTTLAYWNQGTGGLLFQCIFYGNDATPVNLSCADGETSGVVCCTVDANGGTYGITSATTGTVYVWSCYVQNTTTADIREARGWDSPSGWNCTEDATADLGTDAASYYYNSHSLDASLDEHFLATASTDANDGAGDGCCGRSPVNDLSASFDPDNFFTTPDPLFGYDIAGNARPSGTDAAWDVGASEYVAAGASTITAAQGSASITGQAANLLWHQAVKAEQGAVAITGQAANLLWHQLVKAEQGAVAITGQDITLTIVPAAGANSIVAEQGSVAITGQAANLNWHQLVKAEQGAVAVTGQAAQLQWTRSLKAVMGRITANVSVGTDIPGLPLDLLKWLRQIKAEQSPASITGQAANLNWQQAFKAEQGAVAITGQAARLQWMRSLKAEQGALAATGNDVDLLAYRLLKALHATITATGQTASLRYSGAVVGTPAERTYKVPAESRRIVIPAESRTMVIAAENRTIAIGR